MIREEKRDLFTVPQGYYLAHCISSDFALGAGIAKQFREVFNMAYKLKAERALYREIGAGELGDGELGDVGSAVIIDNVFKTK